MHGHGAGPTIGVWGQQDLLPERGNYPLHADTCYALELSIAQDVPEWDNQHVFICLEQTVAFTNNQVEFLDGRQTELLLVN